MNFFHIFTYSTTNSGKPRRLRVQSELKELDEREGGLSTFQLVLLSLTALFVLCALLYWASVVA